jgi:type I restriction enzyme R subunit
MAKISEKQLENAIENNLVKKRPAAGEVASLSGERGLSYVEGIPGGFIKQKPEGYDRELCLDPQMVIAFIYATQPEEWENLKKFHGNEIKDKFLKRLSVEINKRGTLEVLRKGIKDSGCKFNMAYFKPSSGLNPKLQSLYEANFFSFIRQFNYSQKNENSIDLAIFINGLPIFTAELKNPLTSQNVDNAIDQYRRDRDPKEPIFLFGRCLAHFAIDPDLVYMTTRLEGSATFFLPFNQGCYGGAGNPPAMEGYSTSYLWEKIWSKDSILNLIQHFTHIIELEDDEGKKTGKSALIFPRYHQLDCVRRLVSHARANGTGQRYLIEHSAGSGKSNSIAWLAHQLSILHDDKDRRVFDSIIVITDRKILDRQIQHTIKQFEQTAGIVENIDKTSRQLKEALESGKTIIVSTLQKYPMIATQAKDLPGKRFALIIDEAHSSQSGESRKSLNSVLAASSLEDAEKKDAAEAAGAEDIIIAQMKARGYQKNISMFAFTATPKPKTLELFGTKRPDGQFEPFSLYSMRQAIEEKFILDVLQNYVNYRVYWKLLKKIEDDPKYDRKKATYLLRSFIDLHEHAINKKVEVIMEHFHNNVRGRINGKAKAMIVARSRLHAVRYKIAVDKYLAEHEYKYKTLVAFSGEVNDGGVKHTEENMNGFSEAKTAQTFKQDDYRILIVAYKFQTGFDQPMLHTMYVDQKLEGIRAVQTLSRINRTCPGKSETMVLDFVNSADDIQESFQPYYEKTILSEGTDPNQLYDIESRLENKHLYTKEDIQKFADIYFDPKARQDQIYGALQKPMVNYKAAEKEDQVEFRGSLVDYVRLYSFLSQILTFVDPELEKLYHFCRLLLKYIQVEKEMLPVEIQQNIDMDSYRIEKVKNGKIGLDRGIGKVDPMPADGLHFVPTEELEPLSQIIKELNDKFGTNFSEEDKVFIAQLEEKLKQDEALRVSIQSNTKENARLTFNHVVTDRLQGMVDTNFKFYKRITDDEQAGKHFLDWLFEKFLKDNS